MRRKKTFSRKRSISRGRSRSSSRRRRTSGNKLPLSPGKVGYRL